jgi:tetratricopeptide (TPR) repeat protein
VLQFFDALADELDVKLPKLKIPTFAPYLALGLVTSTVVWFVGLPVYHEFNTSFAMKEFKQYGVVGTYHKHFFAFADGLHEIFDLDHENIRLNEEVARLEKELEQEKSGKVEVEAKTSTDTVAFKLKEETGSELATTLENIPYTPPANILPHQLYVLGVSYFRKAEYEEAAVIFSQLLKMKDDVSYQKPENFILGGISWYQLRQYHLAEEFFKTAKEESSPKDANYRAVIVWEALLAKSQGQKKVVNQKMEQLMAQFPHSEELKMMRKAAETTERAPASRENTKDRAYPSKIMDPPAEPEEHVKPIFEDPAHDHTSVAKTPNVELAKKSDESEDSHD